MLSVHMECMFVDSCLLGHNCVGFGGTKEESGRKERGETEHSSFDRHLLCSRIFAVVSNATMSLLVQMFF